MLAAARGTKLRVVADGHDEAEAMVALDGLFDNAFGETEQQVKIDD
jgi:phosphotransferase system HPr-like phosphotransfer protein